ncbi:MAG: hypothetical protein M0Z52_10060 [Actinomycetota bacterium]|nr:hypothetical protein [Actinomycetota bacterium]
MERIWQDRCGWCKAGIQGNPALVIDETKIPVEFERHYIEKIIFLSLKEYPHCAHAGILRGDEQYEHKGVPVFMIPSGEDAKNIAIRTCGKECAEPVKNALENEEYVFEWNFEDAGRS